MTAERTGRVAARGEERLVVRAVGGGAGVVAHAAVDRDVGAHPGNLLDGADGVERDARGRGDGTSRFDRERGRGVETGVARTRSRTLSRSTAANVAIDGASRSSAVYGTPRPPPRLISSTVVPASRADLGRELGHDRRRHARTTRGPGSASRCGSGSRRSRIASDLATRSAASRAAPLATVKPNFESSAPVAMYSCVCASTPGVTRTSTARRGHSRRRRAPRCDRARRRSRRRCGRRPTRARCAARPPTCCCRGTRCARGGNPARSATCSSPPVATSRWSPSLGDQLRHRGAQERLARVRHRRRHRRRRRTRGSAPAARPRRRRTAACRRWRRGRRRRTRRSAGGRRVDRGAARQQAEIEWGPGDRIVGDRGVGAHRSGSSTMPRHLVGRVDAEDRRARRRGRSGRPRPTTAGPA